MESLWYHQNSLTHHFCKSLALWETATYSSEVWHPAQGPRAWEVPPIN